MRSILFGVVLLLPVAVGCKSSAVDAASSTQAAPVSKDVPSAPMKATMDAPILNSTCPMMAGEAIDADETVDYEGGRVAFCCGGCRAKWNDLDAAGKAAALAKAKH
jgi:hypothetical protein